VARKKRISIRPRRVLRRLRDRAQATPHLERLFRRPQVRVLTSFSAEPPIFYVVPDTDYEILFQALRRRRAYFLFCFQWAFDKPTQIAKLVRGVDEHRIVYLCDTAPQQERFERAGLRAIVCNHNSLLDERIFRIDGNVEKRFDAVYDAQINPFKRHLLAARIESLALISYLPSTRTLISYLSSTRTRAEMSAYAAEVRAALPRAHWFSDPFAPVEKPFLSPQQVSESLNRCRVGLCLSKLEGAMYASAQYLLCGLPVVSTRSEGGRDVFFDEEYVRIVEDDPEAVWHAVHELIDLAIPPQRIRSKTLARMWEHRERLVELIQSCYAECGVSRDFREEWDRVFCNKLRARHDLRDVVRRIRRGEVDAPGA
jgi:glycosyltransferase involved in cell wall biosynthesis